MNHYYYHGFEPWPQLGESLEHMISYLESGGIKSRKNVLPGRGEEYNHVCLYRKNEDYDYTSKDAILNSARAGWIDHCMVFVVSPDIEAEKTPLHEEVKDQNILSTNLVDEYRCIGDIPNEKIVGVAVPFESIKEYLEEEPYCEEDKIDKENLKIQLQKLEQIAKELGMFIVNSDDPLFTDRLDDTLETKMKR